MQTATLTLRERRETQADQFETYWVNAELGRALQKIEEGEDVVVTAENGDQALEHKYCLMRAWQDEKSRRWYATFAIEANAEEEEFAGLIRLDVSIALGCYDLVTINWRGC